MPSFVTRRRHQNLIYFPWIQDDIEGRAKVDPGKDMKVRSEDSLTEVLDTTSSNIARQTTIVVDRKIIVRSIVCLGTLASPQLDYVGQVIDYREFPTIKGRYKRREIVVMKYNNIKEVNVVVGGEFDKTEFNLLEFYV